MLRLLIHKVFKGNVFIAICSFSWFYTSFFLPGFELNGAIPVMAAQLMLSTWLMYHLDRVFGDHWSQLINWFKAPQSILKEPMNFAAKVAIPMGISLICAALFYAIPVVFWPWYLPPILLASLYALPILPGGKRPREHPFLKIFLIALVWGWTCGLIPALIGNFEHPILFFTQRTLFIFAVTIPFDLRDMQVDSSKGIKTIPAGIGVIRTKALAVIALGIALFLSFILFPTFALALYLPVYSLSILFILIWKPKLEWPYYLLFLDGCILIEALLTYFICT